MALSLRTVVAQALRAPRQCVSAAKRCYSYYQNDVPQDQDFPAMGAQHGSGVASFSDVQVTLLGNGIRVVSEDDGNPSSSLAVVVGAGARQDNGSGVSSALEAVAFQSTENRTALHIQRETEQYGVTLDAQAGREHIVYTASFARDNLKCAMDNISDAVACPSFNSWEVAPRLKQFVTEQDAQAPETVLLDELHHGAFHTGLGNRLLAPSYKVCRVSPESLKEYHACLFTGGNIVVAGSGVSHDDLVYFAGRNFSSIAPSVSSPSGVAKYYGGYEARVEADTPETLVGVAFEGAAGDGLALQVLGHLLGSDPSVQWGNPFNNKVQEAVGNNVSVNGFSCSYSDGGLVGVNLCAMPESSQAATVSAIPAIRSVLQGDFSEAELERAKARAMIALMEQSHTQRAIYLGSQAFTTAAPAAPESTALAISALTLADVKAAGQKAASSKPVFVVLGDTASAPFAADAGL